MVWALTAQKYRPRVRIHWKTLSFQQSTDNFSKQRRLKVAKKVERLYMLCSSKIWWFIHMEACNFSNSLLKPLYYIFMITSNISTLCGSCNDLPKNGQICKYAVKLLSNSLLSYLQVELKASTTLAWYCWLLLFERVFLVTKQNQISKITKGLPIMFSANLILTFTHHTLRIQFVFAVNIYSKHCTGRPKFVSEVETDLAWRYKRQIYTSFFFSLECHLCGLLIN